MGYYTRFKGNVSGSESALSLLVDATENDETFSSYDIPLNDWFGDWLQDGESMKWYDHEKDCIELSKRFPNVLFALEGEGEEAGDMWKQWFRNGKSVSAKAKIIFDEPDLEKELPLDVESERRAAVEALARAQEKVAQAEAALESARANISSLLPKE